MTNLAFAVGRGQDFLQRLVTARIFFLSVMKFFVKLYQHTLLLQVITKITRLRVNADLGMDRLNEGIAEPVEDAATCGYVCALLQQGI